MINVLKINNLILFLIFILLPASSFPQNKANKYDSIVNQCSFSIIHKNLIEFEKLGVKEAKTNALKNTANWLVNKYKSYGYTNIERDTFQYAGDNLYNLVITKTGSTYPDSILIICGHYDTKNGPGVGDNGSGTAVILEIARILKNINTEISIRFIHFSGEEDGLIGSYHYVNKVVQLEKPKLKLIFNIDAVGGVASKANNTIVCESDHDNYPSINNNESLRFTKLLTEYMVNYAQLQTIIGNTYSSDYMPFQEKGYLITGLYEFIQSPYAHTSKDILENVDIQYIYLVAKGALGATLYFSNGHE